MKYGATFPTHEIGTDHGAIRAFAQAAEQLGYDYVVAIDHVLGVDREKHPGYEPIAASAPRYFLDYAYHELFVLFGFLAAVTERVELFTGVLVLPQRQTALVAKQAAEVDLLSAGRLVLGVGVGHTDVESYALGFDYRTRGRRIDEQVTVLRLLWEQENVTFHGEFHDLDGVGINPRPLHRIPIWMGGWSTPVLRRAARVADGLMMPRRRPEMLDLLRAEHRDPASFGFSDTVVLPPDNVIDDDAVRAQVANSATTGLTHLAVNGQDVGRRSCDEHIVVLERFKAIVGF